MTVQLFHGDCLEIMPTLAAGSVDAVITDPPYPEIDRAYGRMTEVDWHAMMRQVVAETRRVLTPRGSAVFILQPNSEKIGRMRAWLWEFMAWTCREWNMVQDAWWWNTTACPNVHTRRENGLLRPSVKACVWLGGSNCFRAQEVVLWRESQANVAMRATSRAGRVQNPSGMSFDKVLVSGLALERGGATPYNLLPIPNADSSSSAGAFGHGAGTPLPLCEWWARYIVPPGGTVLDMFAGTGTTGIAAVHHGCSYIGIERDPDYFCAMQGRVQAAASQGNLFRDEPVSRTPPAPPPPGDLFDAADDDAGAE